MTTIKRTALRISVLLAFILTATDGCAWPYIDGTRMLLITKWEKDFRKAHEAQMAAQGLMLTQYLWMIDNETNIINIKEKFDKYLSKVDVSQYTALAAEIYGIYYELSLISNSVQNISKLCADGQATNMLAVAFSRKRNKVYVDLIMATTDMVMDLRRIFVGDAKLTEKERLETLDGLRSKIKNVRKKLKKVEIYIYYTNMMDLWGEFYDNAHKFNIRSRREIARQCLTEWKNHYRFKMRDI